MVINQSITLARALKVKKRIESRLSRISSDITKHNSVLVGAVREVDAVEKFKEYESVSNMLIRLRVELWKASLSIQPKILQINECKSQIALLSRLDTTHGLTEAVGGWGAKSDSPDREYKAAFRKSDVDQKICDIEACIDGLQEEIDNHNTSTSIRIEGLEI